MDRDRRHYRDRDQERSGSHRRPQSPRRRSFSPHRRNDRPTQRQGADQRWNTNNEDLIQNLVEHERFEALTLSDLSLRDVTRPSRQAYVFPSLPRGAILRQTRHGIHNPDVLERINTTATPSLNWVTGADKKGEYLIKGTMSDSAIDNLTNTLKDLALKNGGVCYNMTVQFLSVSKAREHHDQVDESWQQARQRLTDQDHSRSRAAARSALPPRWREEDEPRGRAATGSTLPPRWREEDEPRRLTDQDHPRGRAATGSTLPPRWREEDEPRRGTSPAVVKMEDAPPAPRSVLPPRWREEDEPRRGTPPAVVKMEDAPPVVVKMENSPPAVFTWK